MLDATRNKKPFLKKIFNKIRHNEAVNINDDTEVELLLGIRPGCLWVLLKLFSYRLKTHFGPKENSGECRHISQRNYCVSLCEHTCKEHPMSVTVLWPRMQVQGLDCSRWMGKSKDLYTGMKAFFDVCYTMRVSAPVLLIGEASLSYWTWFLHSHGQKEATNIPGKGIYCYFLLNALLQQHLSDAC